LARLGVYQWNYWTGRPTMTTIVSNKADAGRCRNDGDGGRVNYFWRNRARCLSAGFSFVWFE